VVWTRAADYDAASRAGRANRALVFRSFAFAGLPLHPLDMILASFFAIYGGLTGRLIAAAVKQTAKRNGQQADARASS
jgi:hypothetical protein